MSLCLRFLFSSVFIVPDLETVKFKVLSRKDQYEIREVEVWILSFFSLNLFIVPFKGSFIQLIFIYLIFFLSTSLHRTQEKFVLACYL